MSIYVDRPIFEWRGKMWCHLFAGADDPNGEQELHAFAAKLGLKRSWFQLEKAGWPHYDITAAKRVQALRLGAVEDTDFRECMKHGDRRREARKAVEPLKSPEPEWQL